MLSPEIKELCEIAVTLRHTDPWIPKEVDDWKRFKPQSLNVALAALALNEENERLRKAISDAEYSLQRISNMQSGSDGDEDSSSAYTICSSAADEGLDAIKSALGSLPLAGDAPSVATSPNESQPVPLTEDDKRGILADIEQQKRDDAAEVVWVQTH